MTRDRRSTISMIAYWNHIAHLFLFSIQYITHKHKLLQPYPPPFNTLLIQVIHVLSLHCVSMNIFLILDLRILIYSHNTSLSLNNSLYLKQPQTHSTTTPPTYHYTHTYRYSRIFCFHSSLMSITHIAHLTRLAHPYHFSMQYITHKHKLFKPPQPSVLSQHYHVKFTFFRIFVISMPNTAFCAVPRIQQHFGDEIG
jgi:hypothetical protein